MTLPKALKCDLRGVKKFFNGKLHIKPFICIFASALVLTLYFSWLIPPKNVFAIAAPTVLTINNITAYQGVIEDDDQLHIITFTIDYASSPTKSTDKTYLVRLFNDETEIGVVTPYPFYNGGYSEGVVSFYFSAFDANLPTWTTANLSVELTGNPSLPWDSGSPPVVKSSTWLSYNEGNVKLPARIRVLATNLEAVYGVDMIESTFGVGQLTENGENYFNQVIVNLRLMAHSIFKSLILTPEYSGANFTNTYAEASENRWLTSANGTFDLTNWATIWGISRNWTSSIFYVAFCIVVLFITAFRIGVSRGGGVVDGSRPATFIFGALMIFGSFTGFMVFEAGIFAGVIGILAIIFPLFWRGSI
jgi:hypothetical protein|tara:strand:- start:1543 stop:2628 length:1086 start_codon:yes stop_codon:yes gene_type:complete